MAGEITNSLASSKTVQILGNIGQYKSSILWVILGIILLQVFIRFLQHRHQVIIYEKVKDGYVKKSGRYAYALDKKTGLEYLRPMYGKVKYPYFGFEYWQKVDGLPIIGIKRVLSLVKINESTFKPIKVDFQKEVVKIDDFDTLNWLFIRQYNDFVTQYKKSSITYWLGILAPSLVILCSLGFLAIAIFIDVGIRESAVNAIQGATNEIVAFVTRGG